MKPYQMKKGQEMAYAAYIAQQIIETIKKSVTLQNVISIPKGEKYKLN